MKAAVVTFPGSNCDRDLAVALDKAGAEVVRLWHKETVLPPGTDLVAIPGGFSYGDYLRCGAIAAQSPVAGAIRDHAQRGGYVLGVCNGFQMLTELGLLPGALMRNAGLSFVCRETPVEVVSSDSVFTHGYERGARIVLPVAHADGNFQIDADGHAMLEAEGRIALRYIEPFNGSAGDIAGVFSADRRILGLMPHPERAIDPALGSADGAAMFAGLVDALVAA